MINLDWYQATFHDSNHELMLPLIHSFFVFQNPAIRLDFNTPQYVPGFQNSVALMESETESVCLVAWDNSKNRVHIKATGAHARGLDDYLQKYSPHVSRVDLAIDISGAQMFDRIYRPAARFISENKLNYKQVGKWATKEERTLYVGSAKSRVQVRIYEKGHEQIAKGNLNADPDWVRVEIQIRPGSKEKGIVGQMSLDKILSSAGWATDFINAIGVAEIHKNQSFRAPKRTITDTMKKRIWFARTYGQFLSDWVSDAGSLEACFTEMVDLYDQKKTEQPVIPEPCPF